MDSVSGKLGNMPVAQGSTRLDVDWGGAALLGYPYVLPKVFGKAFREVLEHGELLEQAGSYESRGVKSGETLAALANGAVGHEPACIIEIFLSLREVAPRGIAMRGQDHNTSRFDNTMQLVNPCEVQFFRKVRKHGSGKNSVKDVGIEGKRWGQAIHLEMDPRNLISAPGYRLGINVCCVKHSIALGEYWHQMTDNASRPTAPLTDLRVLATHMLKHEVSKEASMYNAGLPIQAPVGVMISVESQPEGRRSEVGMGTQKLAIISTRFKELKEKVHAISGTQQTHLTENHRHDIPID